MKIDAAVLAKPDPTQFIGGSLYRNKLNNLIYIAISVSGERYLIDLKTGVAWSNQSAFGTTGPEYFINVTSDYILRSAK